MIKISVNFNTYQKNTKQQEQQQSRLNSVTIVKKGWTFLFWTHNSKYSTWQKVLRYVFDMSF